MNFAKKWRAKRFCTAPYIRAELKLECSPRTVARCLNRHGHHWRPVLKKLKLKKTDLAPRKVFVDQFLDKDEEWWKENMDFCLECPCASGAGTVGFLLTSFSFALVQNPPWLPNET